MKAVIAAAQTQTKAQEIVNHYYTAGVNVLWANISESNQVTIVYETQQEVDERLEKEFQQAVAQIEATTKKTRKQPTVRDLQVKAKELFCNDLDIYRENGKIIIASDWAGVEPIICNTTTGASRKIKAIYWERQIKHLRMEGLIV